MNHVGAARYFNLAAARHAIAATNAAVGCGPTDINCGIANGLTINDYANNGLDTGDNYLGGFAASAQGVTPSTGAAFPGANPLVGQGNFILPVGKSGYDALQMVFHQVAHHPAPGIQDANVQVSWAFSKSVNTSATGTAGDSFFSNSPWDNDNPGSIVGRSGLDHTQQVNFGGSVHLKYGLQVGMVGHSPATSLTLDTGVLDSGAGNIFQSDLNGDGTTGDLFPYGNPGDYMHRIGAKNLQAYMNRFNAGFAGKLTPAGQTLVNNGLFTSAQLQSIQGDIRPIANLASGTALNNPAFRTMDVNVSYPIRLARFREGLSLNPSVAFYNVGNFSNFGSPGGVLNNVDEPTTINNVNTADGTRTGPNTYANQNANRTLRQSGTFSQGAPRSTEFQLSLIF